jgi:predicted aspartyl protease
MDNVSFVKIIESDGTEVEHAIIDRGNGEYTSMAKSVYDEMIAKRETPTL